MATTYYAANYANQLRIASDSADVSQPFSYTISSAGFIINDLVYLAKIPAGVNILSWYVDFAALDSGTAVRIQLGDGSSASTFMAATLEGGSAAGTIAFSQKDGVLGVLPKSYTAADALIMKVSTAATGTTTSGTIKGVIVYNKIGIAALS